MFCGNPRRPGTPPSHSPEHGTARDGGVLYGVYHTGVPASYTGVTSFTTRTGIRPRLVVYYSGWFEPFQAHFAATVAQHGAVPLVQMNPTGISLAAIASGHYDGYLSAYAEAVREYRHPVILGFGHEMNGDWYSWGFGTLPRRRLWPPGGIS